MNATMNQTKPKEYVYKSTLRSEYGLTPSMVEELGQPDEYVENPYYSSAPMAMLYRIDRVETWLAKNRNRIEKAKESRTRRSAAMKKIHDEKRADRLQEARAWISQAEITCPNPLPATLLDDAQQHYRFSPKCSDYREQPALRAYVRHYLTNYEHLLWEVKRREFSSELYSLLRKRVDEVAAKAIMEWKPQVSTWSFREAARVVSPGGVATS